MSDQKDYYFVAWVAVIIGGIIALNLIVLTFAARDISYKLEDLDRIDSKLQGIDYNLEYGNYRLPITVKFEKDVESEKKQIEIDDIEYQLKNSKDATKKLENQLRNIKGGKTPE